MASGCASGPKVVTLHAAYGTNASVQVDGRMADAAKADVSLADDIARDNLDRTARLFMRDECEHCDLTLGLPGASPVTATTDDDGYFRAELVMPDPSAEGWMPLVVNGNLQTDQEVLVVPAGNRLGIISDIDDTVLVTEVGSLYRMIRNTFLHNPLQRAAVPGLAALYRETLAVNPDPVAAPLFFVSSSPDQLHDYLQEFLDINGFPRSVIMTRRLSLDGDGHSLDAVLYKTARIQAILDQLPEVQFILVGDDGEHDPEVYDSIRRQYPHRIIDIWIRRVAQPGTTALPEGQKNLGSIIKSHQ